MGAILSRAASRERLVFCDNFQSPTTGSMWFKRATTIIIITDSDLSDVGMD